MEDPAGQDPLPDDAHHDLAGLWEEGSPADRVGVERLRVGGAVGHHGVEHLRRKWHASRLKAGLLNAAAGCGARTGRQIRAGRRIATGADAARSATTGLMVAVDHVDVGERPCNQLAIGGSCSVSTCLG
jgi:hypothetical protein